MLKSSTIYLIFVLITSGLFSNQSVFGQSGLYLEDVNVDSRFDYYKVFNEDHRSNLKKAFYWERKTWANPTKVESIIKEYAKSDTSNTFIKYSEIDEQTVFLHLYLNSFYLDEKSNQIVVNYDYDATDYLGNEVQKKKGENIKVEYVDLDYFSLTEYLLAIKIIEKLEDDLDDITVKEVKSLDELNILTNNTRSGLSSNVFDKNLSNNAVAFFYKDLIISGVIISKEGYALTDYRLFRFFTDDKIKVLLNTGDTSSIELIRVNKIHNLALVKIKNMHGIDCRKLVLSKKAPVGSDVFFWGTPGSQFLVNSFAEGMISGNIERHKADYYFVDTMPHWGFTGSAVYNKRNELVGLALLVSFDNKLNLVMPCVNSSQFEDILKLKL